MWVKDRHTITFAILRPIFRIVLHFLYHLKVKKYKLNKNPHIIISNHQTTLDPFILALSFNKPIYFMASRDLFNKGFRSRLIKYLVAPIPKNKSLNDIGAVKDCLRVVKEGGNIAIFPEGNRTYSGKLCYIDPAIVKLIQHLNIPVICYNIHGGYGTSPRWASHISKGKMCGEVKCIINPNEYHELTNEEFYNMLIKAIDVSDAPSIVPFHSSKRAEKLERVLYHCPSCHQVGSLYTKGSMIQCKKCQLSVQYTPNLTFQGSIDFHTVNDWYQYQVEYINNYQFNDDDEFIFTDQEVCLYEINHNKTILLGLGTISISKKHFIFCSKEFTIYFKIPEVMSMTVVGKHKLHFYVGIKTYQIKGKSTLNVLKYMQMFYRIKGVNNEFFRL